MNPYVLSQLAETRHRELIDDACEYRLARAGRPTSWLRLGRTRRSPARGLRG